jgi:hypothetical protein
MINLGTTWEFFSILTSPLVPSGGRKLRHASIALPHSVRAGTCGQEHTAHDLSIC